MAMFADFRSPPATPDSMDSSKKPRGRPRIPINELPFLSKAVAKYERPLMQMPEDLCPSDSDPDEPLFRVSIAHSPVRISRSGSSMVAPFRMTETVQKEAEAVKAKYEQTKSIADVDFHMKLRDRSRSTEVSRARASRAKYREAYAEWKRADVFCKLKGIPSPEPPPKPESPPPRIVRSPRVQRSNPCVAKFNFNPHGAKPPAAVPDLQLPPPALGKRRARSRKNSRKTKKLKRARSNNKRNVETSSSSESSSDESQHDDNNNSTTASSGSPSSYVNEVFATTTGGKFKGGGKGKTFDGEDADPSVADEEEAIQSHIIKIKVGPGREQERKEIQKARNENKKRKKAIENLIDKLNYDGGDFNDGPAPNFDVDVFVSVPEFPEAILNSTDDSCNTIHPLKQIIRPNYTSSTTPQLSPSPSPAPTRGEPKCNLIDIDIPFSVKSKYKDEWKQHDNNSDMEVNIKDMIKEININSNQEELSQDNISKISDENQSDAKSVSSDAKSKKSNSDSKNNIKDDASSSTELPENVSSIRLKALADLSQDQVAFVESLYENMVVTVDGMFDDHLCAALLDGTPYTPNSHLKVKSMINKKGIDESHFMVNQRKLRPTRGGYPGIKTAWELEPETGIYSRAERVRKRTNRFLHSSGDAVIARGPGRWDFRLGHLFPVNLGSILDPVFRLCGRAAAYDGVTKKPLQIQTHQIMVVEPGAEIQPWHQDHDGSPGYFTIMIALNDSDDPHENLQMGGTELCMPTKPPLMAVVPPKKGHGLVFDGRILHRGLSNNSRTTRYFYYVAISTTSDYNTGYKGQ